jgi:hypothetical protein
MTMVRGGEERDLAAIVAIGRARAEPVDSDRFVDGDPHCPQLNSGR